MRLSGLPKITPPFEIKKDLEVKGAVCLNFGHRPLLFLLFPSSGKTPLCKVLFSPEETLCSLAFGLFFSLTRSFPPYILFLSKRKFLSVSVNEFANPKIKREEAVARKGVLNILKITSLPTQNRKRRKLCLEKEF